MCQGMHSKSPAWPINFQPITLHKFKFVSKTGVEFQYVHGGPGARITRTLPSPAWHSSGKAHHFEILVEVNDVQWNPGVLHPEASHAFACEDKKHAVIPWHALPEHQSELLLVRRFGNFHAELLTFQPDVRFLCDTGGAAEDQRGECRLIEN